ncbi:MAG: fibronectin type III domain-containing protein, partial [Lachnospiraceae bacterium]|nr:fibronectin type III domain-containing protein [Lachnospiraceae bacterium]
RNGEGMIWLSYAPASGGGRYSGTFYFDNYRFVYGTNLDDLDNPYFKSLTVNGVSIADETDVEVDSNNVEITATFADVDGKNATGIDTSKTTFVVDGQEIGCDGDENSATTRLELANGLHSVSVTIYDKFGNTNTVTSYVTVANGEELETAVLTGDDTVILGSDYQLSLVTKGRVSALDMTVLQLNSDFGEPVVTAAEGWTVESEYSSTGFKKAKMEIKATWNGEGEAPANATVATLSFNVPTNLDAAIDFFTYQVTKVTCVTAEGKSITSAQQKVVLTLSAYYTVNAAVAVSGADTLITITNPSGEPEEGVEVFVNGQSIGFTDANGEIVTSVARELVAGSSFIVLAKKDSRVSFETTIIVMNAAANAEGKPEGLMHTASRNGDTEQIITWFASSEKAEAAAIVEYSLSSDLSNSTVVTGSNKLHAFATSKDAAYINTVTLTGLEGGKTYYYRAGDGNTWSDVNTFKTTAKDAEVSFFVVGDTQMNGNRAADVEEIQLLKNLGVQVAGSDFGIQTGDYVDNGGNYKMWEEMDSTFAEAFGEADIIHTNGNHEYYGDAYGVAANAIYGLSSSEEEYYSVEYGNVYVAVINYNANLKAACDWLVEDAQASDAQWKFLSIHQPPYYTNVNGGSQRFHNAIPAAAEKAGLDAVFSGHDHSYARTLPMTSGEVDEENGIVYFVCGDLGEKSRNINYAAYNNPDFHFGCIDQSYDAVSIKVTATADELTFTTVDSQGNILDKYVKKSACADGHDWAFFDRKTGLMHCSRCDATASAKEELYSGWLTDIETGKLMYFAAGEANKGFVKVENVPYIFDSKGLMGYDGLYSNLGKIYYFEEGTAVTGLYYINNKYYFFDKEKYTMFVGTKTVSVEDSNGLLSKDTAMTFEQKVEIKKDSKGVKCYYIEGLKSYVGFIEFDGDYYYVCNDGHLAIGYQKVLQTNNLIKAGTYYFDAEGRFDMSQVKNGIYKENGKLYYYKLGSKYYAGLIKIEDDYYYVNGSGVVVTGKYQITKTNGLMKAGWYNFDTDGKMILPEPETIKNGIVVEDGTMYYYVNNKKTYAGLIKIDDDYYYVNGKCIVVTGRYEVTRTNGLMERGWYNFAADGKMILPEPEAVKNGIVVEDGTMYYYVNNKKTYAGLIKIGEDYYYVNGKCIVVTGRYEVTRTNGLMEKGWYNFAADGKMILPEPETIKNGIVVEDGTMYYYVNNKKTYVGLIKIGDDYYYVNGKCVVVTGRYFVTRTNNLMPQGYYNFAEDGKMILPESEESVPAAEEITEGNNEGVVEVTVPEETPEDQNVTESEEEPVDESVEEPSDEEDPIDESVEEPSDEEEPVDESVEESSEEEEPVEEVSGNN